MEVVELRVPVHCKACEKSVRRTLHKLKGVTCVEIDVIASKISVLGYIDQRMIVKAVRRTGRPASNWPSHLHGSSTGNSTTAHKTGRRLLESDAGKQVCNVTGVPAMEEKFLRRKSYIAHKILRAMCLKGK